MAQEWREEEVELALAADFEELGIAETDGFALAVGSHGDLGGGREGDSDAGASDGLAHAGASFHFDDDAVLNEGDSGFP